MGYERVDLALDQAVETEELRDGTKVTVRRVEGAVTDWSVNSTAYHESCHALAAMLLGITVYAATDQPGPGYGGATWVDGYDRRVAAAAEAKGCSGTGHDMMTVAMMGDSPSGAVSEAATLLSGQDSQLLAVATAIQRRGTVSGGDMHAAHDRVQSDLIEVTTEGADGTVTTETLIANNGSVAVTTTT
jgi:hypothetical protein